MPQGDPWGGFGAQERALSTLDPGQEPAFKKWYAGHAAERGLSPNPDDPEHHYDYRAAFRAGAAPDDSGHWPSKFKLEGHPNRFVNGEDTMKGGEDPWGGFDAPVATEELDGGDAWAGFDGPAAKAAPFDASGFGIEPPTVEQQVTPEEPEVAFAQPGVGGISNATPAHGDMPGASGLEIGEQIVGGGGEMIGGLLETGGKLFRRYADTLMPGNLTFAERKRREGRAGEKGREVQGFIGENFPPVAEDNPNAGTLGFVRGVSGVAPLVAAGPFAPVAMGVLSARNIEQRYDELVRAGVPHEQAQFGAAMNIPGELAMNAPLLRTFQKVTAANPATGRLLQHAFQSLAENVGGMATHTAIGDIVHESMTQEDRDVVGDVLKTVKETGPVVALLEAIAGVRGVHAAGKAREAAPEVRSPQDVTLGQKPKGQLEVPGEARPETVVFPEEPVVLPGEGPPPPSLEGSSRSGGQQGPSTDPASRTVPQEATPGRASGSEPSAGGLEALRRERLQVESDIEASKAEERRLMDEGEAPPGDPRYGELGKRQAALQQRFDDLGVQISDIRLAEKAAPGVERRGEARPGEAERRQNTEQRQTIEEQVQAAKLRAHQKRAAGDELGAMAEMEGALEAQAGARKMDKMTGLPNKEAFEEAPREKGVESGGDVNGLGWMNDKMGHEVGNQALTAVGHAFRDVAAEYNATAEPGKEWTPYHVHGDEFPSHGPSREVNERLHQEVNNRLKDVEISGKIIDPKDPNFGKTVRFKGLSVAWGHGEHGSGIEGQKDYYSPEAERGLAASKAQQELAGVRSKKGTPPPGAVFEGSETAAPPAAEPAPAEPPVEPQGERAPEAIPKPVKAPAARETPPGEAPPAKEDAPEPAPELTSTKKAVMQEERAGRGADPLEDAIRKSRPESFDAAKSAMDADPSLGDRVVKGEDTPSLSRDEREAVLGREKVSNRNEKDRIQDALIKAQESGDEAASKALREQAEKAEARAEEIDKATQREGVEWARQGGVRQMLIDRDYGVHAVERRLRAAKGKPLTADERVQAKETSEKLIAAEKRVTEVEAELADKRKAAKIERAMKPDARKRLLDFFDKEANEARERLAKKRGRAGGGLPFDPQDIADVARIAASHIAHGIDAGAQLVKDFGEAIKPHIQAILAQAKKIHRDAILGEKASKTPPDELGMRSTLEDAAATKLPNRGTGQQFLKTLENQSGISPEEFEWSGLRDFLKGKLMTSKEEVQNFLKQSNVKVEEKTLGKTDEPAGRVERLPNGLFRVDYPGLQPVTHARREGADAELTRMRKTHARDDTKFSRYQLPGGENYRELLLKMGGKLSETPGEAAKRLYPGRDFFDLTHSEMQRANDEAEMAKRPAFRGGHFDEPNILAHLRVNDRTTADGKKMLFIEEVQSDWHQKGRKQGYQEPRTDTAALEKELASVRKIQEQAAPRSPAYEDAVRREREIVNQLNPQEHGGAVPDAPFKKTWHELALKRAIRYAAENGYDSIGWTKGEQQAERYDLSKQIKSLHIERIGGPGDPLYVILAKQHEGRPQADLGAHPAEALPDIIGKEMAEKVVNNQEKVQNYAGLDLKVGGEGMRGFYDKMLPAAAEKIGKVGGAKVGEARIPAQGGKPLAVGMSRDLAARLREMDNLGFDSPALAGGAILRHPDWKTRWDIDPEHVKPLEEWRNANMQAETVHELPITPALRTVATEQGFPRFGTEAAKAQPSAILDFIGKKAEEARARIKERGPRAMAGIDPADLRDRLYIGADYLANDIVKLAEWSKEMVKTFGEDIRPHLEDLYEKSQALLAATKKRLGSEQASITRATKGAAKLREKAAAGDFTKPEKPEPPPKSPLLLKAQTDLAQARRDYNRLAAKHAFENRTKGQKAKDAARESLNVPKQLLTAFDLSATLFQGGALASKHPIEGARAFKESLRALGSERADLEIDTWLRNREHAAAGEKAELELTTIDGPLSSHEEHMRSNWAEKLPLGIGEGVKASNRAFRTFLNVQRALRFDSMIEGLPDKSAKAQNAIANYVNVATGRGYTPAKFRAAMNAAANVLWSPRLLLSRMQLLAGQPLYRGTKASRMAIAGEYAKSLVALGGLYAVAKMAGADVEEDPRSSNFGKIKVGNDTYIDPLLGLSQVTTLTTRIVTGETKTQKGKIEPLRVPIFGKGKGPGYGQSNTADVVFRFLRTKFSPTIGIPMDVLTGKNVAGEPVAIEDLPKELAVPLAFQDVYELMQKQGVEKGTALSLLALLGGRVQVYSKKK